MRRVDRLLRATARAEGRHFWFRGFRAFVIPMVRRALADRADPLIADCGCGTGANVEMLAAFGRSVGFDLSSTGLRLGREAGRTHLACATVTAAPFGDASFDLVTSFDVLYSLSTEDARTAVAEMGRILKPGGFAIVNVAAMSVLRGDHSILSHEQRRYSRRSLIALVRSAGLEPVRTTYTNATLFLPMLLVRSLHRLRGLADEADAQAEITIPPWPINELLSGLLWLESLWARRFDLPFGSSLLCLARKPG
jgi:SAM-dependent methyltransferase